MTEKNLDELVNDFLATPKGAPDKDKKATDILHGVQNDEELKAATRQILEEQGLTPGNMSRHFVSEHVLSTIADVIDRYQVKELGENIRKDLIENYGIKNVDDQHLRRLALIAYTVNSLVEESRQVAHKLAPVVGGGLTEQMLDLARAQVNQREMRVAIAILKSRVTKIEEKGGDERVG